MVVLVSFHVEGINGQSLRAHIHIDDIDIVVSHVMYIERQYIYDNCVCAIIFRTHSSPDT